jgi:DNA-directed RNA polymerase II subunit RPB2
MESLSDEGLGFLEKYFRETEFALTRHHLDSYEQCVFEEIPSIIHSANPIVFLKDPLDREAGVFGYRVEIFIGGDVARPGDLAIKIAPPVVVLDGGNTVRRMLPNEARLRNLTYAAQISADILIRVTFTRPVAAAAAGGPASWSTEVKEALLIRDFPLFKLPVLLRSRLCATGVADPARLEEMGECRNDNGGYFIISGAEKVLITREEQAFNSLYVDRKADPRTEWLGYASVVSLNPETKQTRRVALYQMPGGEIRVAIPMVRGAFPLFILFRALGVESDREIVRMIFPAADPLEEMLVESIADAYPIANRYTAIQYIKTLTKGFTEAHVLDILGNLMLPHVPDEPLARAQYLAEMTRELLLVLVGQRTKTDRDDMRTQRFLTTGVLVRELFNAAWKDWRAQVILTIDRTYRRNEQLYAGEGVFDLFAPANLPVLFQPETLNRTIMRGFRGKWGTNEMNEKTGVLQPLARISYLDALSHTRRVVSDFPSGMKTTGPRKLATSQIGYFCTSETPQGAHIGLTKNMSMMTQFSFGAPMGPVLAWLKERGGVVGVAATTPALRSTAAIVQINGGTVGFTTQPVELVRVLRLLKWNACLSPTASVSFNTLDRTVRIYLDEGRPLRPLWHLEGGGGGSPLERLEELRRQSWRQLVLGTHPATVGATLRTTRFLDPLADAATPPTLADYEAALSPTAGAIEYCDPGEMNEAYIAWWGTAEELGADGPGYTHCEIHPSTIPGVMASMIPYSNHNQAPRNQLSNSQSKQGIGYMATNIKNRYDTYAHQLCYGEAPLCRTFYYETIANGEMPYGFNCMIAATSESGYNQDDGLIINRDSVARGMFQSLSFRSYDCAEEMDSRTKVHSHIANPGTVPAWTALRPGLDYSRLDERGIIREGEIVDSDTVLVGRYMVLPDTNEVKDASVTPELYTGGRVDSVVVLHQGDGRLLVKVRVIQMRTPVLGDKFSSRHGQKGTIGMFVSSADMPRTADGMVPDVMVNPGGLISRMTVAQLVEMVAGRAGAELAAKMNATLFCNDGKFVGQVGDLLAGLGASRAGDNVLYSGITGEQLRTDIFMCPLYFMRLKHLTEDKVNARGAGRREAKTHQPTGGRANEGGLRIGELERDALCAHGVSAFLQESMMKRGDATEFWVCNGCGRIPIVNEDEGLFVCPACDGPLTYNGVDAATMTLQLPVTQSRATFSRVAMPYTLKLLDQEMVGIGNFGMRFVTEAGVGRLREGEWEWPTEAVAFEVEKRVAAEVEEVAKPRAKEGEGTAVSTAMTVGAAGAGEELIAGIRAASNANAEAEAIRKEVYGEGAGGAGAGAGPIGFDDRMRDVPEVALSNFAAAAFAISDAQLPGAGGAVFSGTGIPDWPTVEHYYQAMKFPQDPAWQRAIRAAPTPARAKKMGLDPAHPVRADWESVKERVMKAALLAKFRQNPALLAFLQGTAPRRLRYTNTGDVFWGVGRGGDRRETTNGDRRETTGGQNRLGLMLEEVRRELANVRVDELLLREEGDRVPTDVKASEATTREILRVRGPPQVDENRPELEAEVELAPANLVSAAQALVADATGGQVMIAANNDSVAETKSDDGVVPAPAQVGGAGVYMFINPLMGDQRDIKARRSRQGGGRGALRWDGMPGFSGAEGGGGTPLIQEGGHAAAAGATGSTEVTVVKEGQ